MSGKVREQAEKHGIAGNRDDGISYDGPNGVPEGPDSQNQPYKQCGAPPTTPKRLRALPPTTTWPQPWTESPPSRPFLPA